MPGAVGTRAGQVPPASSLAQQPLPGLAPPPKWGSSVLFGERPRRRRPFPTGGQRPVNRPVCPSIALSDPCLGALCCRAPPSGTKSKELPGASTAPRRPALGSGSQGSPREHPTGRLVLCAGLRGEGFQRCKVAEPGPAHPLPCPAFFSAKAWPLCQGPAPQALRRGTPVR